MNVPSLPALPCLCANLRRASRALSQRYDEALRPVGLTVTQFTILQALSMTGDVSQGRLGEILAMDSTTLTRTLNIMKRNGWIVRRYGADRRERWVTLSPSGTAQFNAALPHWEAAQAKLRASLGDTRWGSLLTLVNDATAAVAQPK